jgi:hypothetical protein
MGDEDGQDDALGERERPRSQREDEGPDTNLRTPSGEEGARGNRPSEPASAEASDAAIALLLESGDLAATEDSQQEPSSEGESSESTGSGEESTAGPTVEEVAAS